MGNVLVLGKSDRDDFYSSLENVEYKSIEPFSVDENGERELNDYVIRNVPNDITAFCLDVDSFANPEFCLALAMTLRLSINELDNAALAPIILVSNVTIEIFYEKKYSQIILTKGVTFEKPDRDRLCKILKIVKPITAEEYKLQFLDFIKILPNASEGRHSIANQWGADVLNRMLSKEVLEDKLIRQARASLYYKYVLAHSMPIGNTPKIPIPPFNACGKKILLIDDEANKGWFEALKKMLFGADVKVMDKAPINKNGELYKELHDEIEEGYYDLIFLDLRLLGTSEERVSNPNEFSGVKVLRKIKEINKGTQVIILTASNKVWNLQTLLDAGADGYYIKESPEYMFSRRFSEENARELLRCAKRCLDNKYLRDIYRKIKKLKALLKESNCFEDKTEEILNSIDIAYDLLARSNDNNRYKAYSYLQLFLIIEEYVKLVTDDAPSGLYLINGEKRYKITNNIKEEGKDICRSKIVFKGGHYILQDGQYKKRNYDTNFKVSALLIFKFSNKNSSVNKWTDVYGIRNNKVAHPENDKMNPKDDFECILEFLLYFFDIQNEQWRDINDAFPDKIDKELIKRNLGDIYTVK